ncbi:MAG: hypothetical protein NVV59_17725 [Chitinophagaceae bacterium]|nr:hypothetical protein [Chitinophagaceae bacterium]
MKKVKKVVGPKEQLEQEQLFVESDKISPVNKKIDKKEIVKNRWWGGNKHFRLHCRNICRKIYTLFPIVLQSHS